MGETLEHSHRAGREIRVGRRYRNFNWSSCKLAGQRWRYSLQIFAVPSATARALDRLLTLWHARFWPMTIGLSVILTAVFWWIGVGPWLFRMF